ncbi:hypothetical protein WA171_004128 [Blastocystis sp. BT1]
MIPAIKNLNWKLSSCWTVQFRQISSLVFTNKNIGSGESFQNFLEQRELEFGRIADHDESAIFLHELSQLQKNAGKEISLKGDSTVYSLVRNSFLCIDKAQRESFYANQVSLAFFASLFADRQGSIFNMSSDSVVASLLMNLYSGYNQVILNESDKKSFKELITLNCLSSRILPQNDDSLSSVQTIFYCIPEPISQNGLPAYTKDNVKQIEDSFGLKECYHAIEEAGRILRNSNLSEERKQLIPTERSLFMLCSSSFLPYFYHRFKDCDYFDCYCCSLLKERESEDVTSSQLLVRAYIQDEGDEAPSGVTFSTYPTVALLDETGNLSEDVTDFIKQIPGYKTYSFYV